MRRVGAMRGLISLAVIFFVALSAQASAKTFVRCVPEKNTYLPSGTEIEFGETWTAIPFTFSYDSGKGSKIKNFSSESDCSVVKDKTNELYIEVHCGPEKGGISGIKLKVDRMTGKYRYRIEYSSSKDDAKDSIEAVDETGSCQKVKQKF